MKYARLLVSLFPILLPSVKGIPVSAQAALNTATIDIVYTLNLFSLSVDSHNYTILDSVFTADAVADFATTAGYVKGLSTIQEGLQAALAGTVSQHALSTYIIDVHEDTSTATATTYLQGTFFGQGNFTGQYVTAFGS
ncbi:hypothetical protein MMC32_006213 [Xylographa parallela]|nr:hypothetical protein [Xylographa parallela]